jgi:hypothetical protein
MPVHHHAQDQARARRGHPLPALAVRLSLASLLALLGAGCENPVKEPPASQRVFTPITSATGAEVATFLAAGNGGAKAKLIYVDKTSPSATLCYLDFSESAAAPAIHVIAAAKNPAVPVISPDGQWAVYASGNGAEAGSPPGSLSSVWLVRISESAQPVLIAADSASEPRFVQNPKGKLTILFSTQAPDLAWEGHGRTMQVEVDVSGAAPAAGTPQVLWAGGGYTGGLSWDGRFLCGGGAHVAMLDMTGAKGRPDTLSPNLVQSCNASISSSRIATNTMMYLTKETSSPNVNGGKPFGEWQAILISDAAKRLVKGYTYPTAFQHPVETAVPSLSGMKWHHCEWSNHPYFAAATLNVDRFFKAASGYDNTNFQERIYLINLKDSTYLEVLRPDAVKTTGKLLDTSGMHWPWLWVEVPAGFEEAKDWLAPKP